MGYLSDKELNTIKLELEEQNDSKYLNIYLVSLYI